MAAGAVAYELEMVRPCLDLLTHGVCYDPPTFCQHALHGQVDAGGACPLGLECNAQAYCEPDPQACPRRCVARPLFGEACDPLGVPCSGSQCVDGACRSWAGEGQPCDRGPCTPGTHCVEGACVPAALLGEGCAQVPCAAGLACVSARCQALGAADAPCDDAGDCSPGLACVGGRCAALPGAGEPCFDLQCAGARCDLDAVPPTCVAWPAASDPCLPGDRCAPSDRCVAGACQPKAAAGEACAQAADCATGRCGGAVCRAPDEPLCPVE